jgi:hypothetical protein
MDSPRCARVKPLVHDGDHRAQNVHRYRGFLRGVLAVLLLLSPLALAAERPCPLCGGTLTTVGQVSTRLAKPIRNCSVWPGASCVNWSHNAKSLICTRCWHARSNMSLDDTVETWMRSSWIKESFYHALTPAIRNLPEIPNSGFNYHQMFVGAKREESAATWTKDRPKVLARLKNYCERHGLRMEIDRPANYEGEVYVTISPAESEAP